MKALVLVTAFAAAVALVAASAVPADAASKKKSKRVAAAQQATSVSQDAYMVIDGDGEILGRDPDSFIRLMLRKDGNVRHHSGR
jgi:outer membrane receptor protein involved in Fe transport